MSRSSEAKLRSYDAELRSATPMGVVRRKEKARHEFSPFFITA
jgi:hypothetical protein